MEGVHFPRAYSACPTCIPARATLWTGRKARSLGLVGYDHQFRWDFEDTLAGCLSQAGYHTQLVGKMHASPSRSLVGFHNVVLHDGTLGYHRKAPIDCTHYDDYTHWLRERIGQDADLRDTGLGVNSWVVNAWPYEERYHPTNWVASQSIEFLKRRDPDKPFFLTASFVRPHAPFDPPQHLLERYLNKPMPEIPVGEWVEDPEDTCRKGLRASFGRGRVDREQLNYARAAYFALITHIDHQINRILLALSDHGLKDDTLIIFASDHGEMLGDHNFWAKAVPFEASTRIPLIIRPPRNGGQALASKPQTLAELSDLFPTICDYCDVSIPSSIEGKSLKKCCYGEDTDVRDHLHGEHFFGAESNQWIVKGPFKYIWFTQTGRELLFNLRKDPNELHNLADSEAEILEDLRLHLVDVLRDAPEGFVQGDSLVPGRPQAASLHVLEPSRCAEV